MADVSGLLIGTSGGRLSAAMCRKVALLFQGVQDFVPMARWAKPMSHVEW